MATIGDLTTLEARLKNNIHSQEKQKTDGNDKERRVKKSGY